MKVAERPSRADLERLVAMIEDPLRRTPMLLAGATAAFTPSHVLAAVIAARASPRIGPRLEGAHRPGQTLEGAELWVVNPDTGQEQVLPLAASNWSAVGAPVYAYRYRDADRELGPCRSARVQAGSLRASCRGDDVDFLLAGGSQGSLAAAFTLGDAVTYCAHFGGRIARDAPAQGRRPGGFAAADAPAPAHCPLP